MAVFTANERQEMPAPVPHPYEISVVPLNTPGQFGWTLRKEGRLFERSDRAFFSAEKAYENALRSAEYDRRPRPDDRH